jgi:hypothetical protein
LKYIIIFNFHELRCNHNTKYTECGKQNI